MSLKSYRIRAIQVWFNKVCHIDLNDLKKTKLHQPKRTEVERFDGKQSHFF